MNHKETQSSYAITGSRYIKRICQMERKSSITSMENRRIIYMYLKSSFVVQNSIADD